MGSMMQLLAWLICSGCLLGLVGVCVRIQSIVRIKSEIAITQVQAATWLFSRRSMRVLYGEHIPDTIDHAQRGWLKKLLPNANFSEKKSTAGHELYYRFSLSLHQDGYKCGLRTQLRGAR